MWHGVESDASQHIKTLYLYILFCLLSVLFILPGFKETEPFDTNLIVDSRQFLARRVCFLAKTSTSHPHRSSNCTRVFHNFTCNEPKRVSWEECFSSTAGQRRGSSYVRLYGCGIVRLLMRLLNGAKTQFWKLQVVNMIIVESHRRRVCFGIFVGILSWCRFVWSAVKR